MQSINLSGAQWWDYAMLVCIVGSAVLMVIHSIVVGLSCERISYLESVDWHGRFNTHDVYGIKVTMQRRRYLRKVTTTRSMIVVHALTEFRDNKTWEELPIWLPAQIGRYVATHYVPTKPYLEIMHCVTSKSRA